MRIGFFAGLALASAVVGGCASLSVTTGRPGEVLICDGLWGQSTMFGHASAYRRMLVYPNPDPTKIRVESFGRTESVCIDKPNATCKVTHKGHTLIVTSTFPHWLGTQTFSFDADAARMSFGVGGLDGGQDFSGNCRRKTD